MGSAIEALAKYADKEGWGYVIEGYHVTPLLLTKLRDTGIEFTSIVLVNSDPQEAIERSRHSDVKNDWIRDNTKNEETYAKICAGIKEHSERLIQESKECAIRCIDMAEDFETKTAEVYRLLTE